MAGERYTQEFKIAAVKQITQEGHYYLCAVRQVRCFLFKLVGVRNLFLVALSSLDRYGIRPVHSIAQLSLT